jgi:hypothetical protein
MSYFDSEVYMDTLLSEGNGGEFGSNLGTSSI